MASRLNGVNEKAQNSIIIVIGLSETAISLTAWLLLILCIISASLEKVATCSLSKVGCNVFTQTFFDLSVPLYVDAKDPLPKNKYHPSKHLLVFKTS